MRRYTVLVALALALAWALGGSHAPPAWAQDPARARVSAARQALDQAVEAQKGNPSAEAAEAVRAAQAEYRAASALYQGMLEARVKELTPATEGRVKRGGEPDAEWLAVVAELAALASPSLTTDPNPTMRPEVEPNNTPAQATPLILSSPAAAVAYGSLRKGDIDFYSFTAPAGARLWTLVDPGGATNPGSIYLDTKLTLISGDALTPLELDDNDGTATGCDPTVDDGSASAVAGAPLVNGGTYSRKVESFAPTLSISPYRLFLYLTTDQVAESEPNDTPGQAQTLGAGSSVLANLVSTSDVDVYALPASQGNLLHISLNADPERDGVGTDTEVDVLDPDGTTIWLTANSSGAGTFADPAAEALCLMAVKTGTYTVRVRPHAGATGSYAVAAVALSGAISPFTAKPVVRVGGQFQYRTSLTSGPVEFSNDFALAGDIPLMCDWDGNGTKTPGVFRNGQWFARNSHTTGAADLTFNYGQAGDVPICGDWDGDGRETPGIVRNGVWYLRNSATSGPADTAFAFGLPGDTPVVGDWNGDGVDTVGVVRNGTWHLRDVNAPDPPDYTFVFGLVSDTPVVGDWDGDGADSPGVYRAGTWFLRNSLTSGPGEQSFSLGAAGNIPLTWK